MAAGEELSRLEELLRRPDFVLEPSVKESVRQYIKAGGKPEVILESLSEGYIGYPQMAMLMVKWMEYVDDEPPSGHDEFHYLKEFAKSKFDPDKFVSVFGAQSSSRAPGLGWLDGLLADPRGRKLIYELSAVHRNSLLLNFAIQKIMKMGHQDEVAAAGSGLASYFSVFHKLLANKVQALLAAVRRAAEAEAAAAAAAASAAASGSGAMATSSAAAAAEAAAVSARAAAHREMAVIVKELRDSCEHSQHTFLHVQHILRHLGSQPGGEVLMAAAQQLEADVAAAAPAVPVWSMQKLYAPLGSPPALVDAFHLAARVLQAGPDGRIASDVMRLHALYGGGGRGGGAGGGGDAGGSEEGAGPAGLSPVALQHPRLIQALLACIFTPTKPPSSDILTACADLLARATCTRPVPALHTGSGGGGSGGGGGACDLHPNESDLADPAAAAAAEELERREETSAALQWAVGLLSPVRHHGRSDEDLGPAPQLSRLPIVAHGLLHAVGCQLGTPSFYEDLPAAAAAVPGLLRTSLLVAEAQPQLTSKILASWSVALTELPRAGLGDLVRLVLDGCLVLMVRAGAADTAEAVGAGGARGGGSASGGGDVVREVLELVEGWSRQGSADPGWVRYFVLQALALFSPPYSPELCGSLLRLLQAGGVRSANVGRNETAAALLREFAAAAELLLPRLQPPATAREQYLLTDLMAAGTGSGGPAGAGR